MSLALADAAFVDERYEDSVSLYNDVIASGTSDAVVFSHRAAAYLKLNKYDDALEDAITAVRLAAAAGSGADECMALLRKGYATRSVCASPAS